MEKEKNSFPSLKESMTHSNTKSPKGPSPKQKVQKEIPKTPPPAKLNLDDTDSFPSLRASAEKPVTSKSLNFFHFQKKKLFNLFFFVIEKSN